ncbi:hypothetical protein [Actinophytocola xanthii]|uniref:hypothetical protein n=1 Tax=Actinophytocola xanthii TaxID=1912961 RepID=UPI00117744B3|nr:hypothetical protein [Actinophytocola xanthii]
MSEDQNLVRSAGGPPSPGRGTQAVMGIINGALVGVGTLYLATKSIAVAAVGAITATALAGLYLLLSRRS